MKRIFAFCMFVLLLGWTPGNLHKTTGLIRHYLIGSTGTFDVSNADMWIDFSQDPTSSPITSSDGGYSFTVTGGVDRFTDGTWPTGSDGAEGYLFDFDGGHLSITDAGGGSDFDPAGDFTVIAVVILDEIDANTRGIVGKGVSGSSTLGWGIYATDDDLFFTITKDGSTLNTIQQTAIVKVGVPLFVMATYNFVADGTSEMSLYANEATVATDLTSPGPVHNSTADFEIGRYNGANTHSGRIQHLAYYDGVVFDSDRYDRLKSQWVGNTSDVDNRITTTNANMATTQLVDDDTTSTNPFIVEFGEDTVPAGAYGIFVNPAITNYVRQSSLEAYTSGGSCTDYPTGWTCLCTAGDGTTTLSENNDDMVNGEGSLQVDMANTTGNFYCYSDCYTTGINTTIDMCAYVKKLAGTNAQPKIGIWQFNNATCTLPHNIEWVATPTITNGDWNQVCKRIAAGDWDGTTQSYAFVIREYGDNNTVVFDHTSMFRASSTTNPALGCVCGDAASCTCDFSKVQISNHGIDVGSWTIEMDVRTVVNWNGFGKYFAYLQGTAGNNNRIDLYNWYGEMRFVVYTKTGAAKTSTVSVGAAVAGTTYKIKAVHTAEGDIWVCLDDTCGTRVTGAERDGSFATLVIGSNGLTGSMNWYKNIRIYNRVK